MKLVDGKLAVKKDGGDVDALTAATISSRAYVRSTAHGWLKERSDDATPTDVSSGERLLRRKFGRGTEAGGSGKEGKMNKLRASF